MIPPDSIARRPRCSAIPFRVRVGVTGHRTLADPETVAGRVREVLARTIYQLFDEPLPRGACVTPLAFTVITALAEGSDRVVAREVLKTPDSEIEVILPRERQDYLQDFSSDQSRREFEQLCGRATRVETLEGSPPAPSTEKDGRPACRDAGFLLAGQSVVTRCEVLIAIWDGRPSRGTGGTADIVALARAKGHPLVLVSPEAPYGIGVEKGRSLRTRVLDRLNMFNARLVATRSRQGHEESLYRNLFAGVTDRAIPEERRSLVREALLPFYVNASGLANERKRTHSSSGLLIYVLSPLVIAVVALGTLVPPLAVPAYATELALLSAILFVVIHADKRKLHKTWTEVRFVAERIRSAMFCVSCGVAPTLTGIPPWLVHTTGPDEWAYRAGDEISRRIGALSAGGLDSCAELCEFVQRAWIDDQIRYHERRVAEVGGASKRLERAGKWVFAAAIVVAAVHLSLVTIGWAERLRALESPTAFLALVLPVLGASIGGIRTHREYSRLVERHQVMVGILRHLRARYGSETSLERLYGLLRETEDVMVREAGEWLALMRYTRIDPV